ncbi:hypothetical protein Hypma_005518 [Hypsizygus marmoreus]|uniref:Uncharacterized protein n=1 Tax=Hypsizygus marmoreus TaxID=39966 RepID=A0A369K1P2_HYPMA|nr:hypothetical protein Hypma_005518 [Hypsizygus marmoreus]
MVPLEKNKNKKYLLNWKPPPPESSSPYSETNEANTMASESESSDSSESEAIATQGIPRRTNPSSQRRKTLTGSMLENYCRLQSTDFTTPSGMAESSAEPDVSSSSSPLDQSSATQAPIDVYYNLHPKWDSADFDNSVETSRLG